jgi:hypothetical protein
MFVDECVAALLALLLLVLLLLLLEIDNAAAYDADADYTMNDNKRTRDSRIERRSGKPLLLLEVVEFERCHRSHCRPCALFHLLYTR